MKSIGLVLSGGGARGAAHLGVIKALEEHEVKISAISGASAGAILGVLYGYGYSVAEILKIIKEIKAYKLFQPAMSLKGLLNMDVLFKFLEKYIPENSFSKLNIPVYVAATKVKTGTTEYFNEGDDLIGAVCASSCIPVLFDPVMYNNELYIDGGILCNLPCEILKDRVDVLIGVHSNPVDHDFSPKNARLVMERALLLAISCNVYSRKPMCDVFIEPKGLEKYKVMDFKNIDDIYQIGYEYTLEIIKEKNLIENFR